MGFLTINGKSIADYKDSYTLIYTLENIMATFNRANVEEKKNLLCRMDVEISEKFEMSQANFIYKNNENVLDDKNIYIGPIEDFNSGLELIARYFFEKRQQYQRICVLKNDKGSFEEEDFLFIKESFDILPLTKEKRYIPYSKGYGKYLQNGNKVDALSFMWEQLETCLSMVNYRRIAQSISFLETLRMVVSINRIQREETRFSQTLDNAIKDKSFGKKVNSNYLKFEEARNNELFIMETLMDSLCGKLEDKSFVIYCFNEAVWDNLNYSQKVKAINICNEFIRETLGCSSLKRVSFKEGKNSYDFVNNDCVYVGDVKYCNPIDILNKLIYEYSFNANYEKVLNLDDNKKSVILKEIEECRKILEGTGDYRNIRNYRFVKSVVKCARSFQKDIYECMSKYFVVEGQKIDMPISKKRFVSDLYNGSKRR